jgi:F-type H+-transporting ATPase subunit delta
VSQAIVSAEIIEPYAEALMSLAQASNQTGRFGDDLSMILDLLKSSPELEQFLGNPFVTAEAKKGVLRRLMESQVDGTIFKFLMLLVDRRRIIFLSGICQQYKALLRKLNNAVLAEVTSTVELGESQRQAIMEKVRSMTGASQVDLDTRIDPELIGGVIVKVGSQVLDSSIRGQLRRMSNALLSQAG